MRLWVIFVTCGDIVAPSYLWVVGSRVGYLGEARQVCVTCGACWRARFRPLMAGVVESRENNSRLSCFVANLAPPPR